MRQRPFFLVGMTAHTLFLQHFGTLFTTYFIPLSSLFVTAQLARTWICTSPKTELEKAPVNPEVTVDQSGVWICHHGPPNLCNSTTNPPAMSLSVLRSAGIAASLIH